MDRRGVKQVAEFKLESREGARRVQLLDGDDMAQWDELQCALSRTTQSRGGQYGAPALAGMALGCTR